MWILAAADTMATTPVSGLLLSTGEVIAGASVLAAVIGALFVQLMRSKSETTEAYKSVLPITIVMLESNKNMEEIVERLEQKITGAEARR